jgi:hypothetical protein
VTEITSLQQQLEQYSLTVKGQTNRRRSAAEIAGYAAAAGAAMAMAGTADASIIYSGVRNISVQINPNAVATHNVLSIRQSTNIDIDGGGADLFAQVHFFAGFSTTHPTHAKYVGSGRVGGATGGAKLLQGTARGVANLHLSSMIGPGGNFRVNPGGFSHSVSVGGSHPASIFNGNFALGVTGIAGFQLASGNFGWIRLRIDDLGPNQPFGGTYTNGQNFPDKITIIDWAYDNSGAPIHVADTGRPIPEPSSLVLLASGAAGIAAFRRRKAERRV